MVAVVALFVHHGKIDKVNLVLNFPNPDDYAVTDGVVRSRYPDEIAHFGVAVDRVRGDRGLRHPNCAEVLASYGMSSVQHIVNGGQPILIA